MKLLKRYLTFILIMVVCFSISINAFASGSQTGYIQYHNINVGDDTSLWFGSSNYVRLDGGPSKTLLYCITPNGSSTGSMKVYIKNGLGNTIKIFTATIDGYSHTKDINLVDGNYYVVYDSVTTAVLTATFSFYN